MTDQWPTQSCGWHELASFDDLNAMTLYCANLGVGHVGAVQRVRPLSVGVGRGHAFSNIHGYGPFPLHTDTAFWSVPARFVLMQAQTASSTPTVILGPEHVARLLSHACASRAIFRSKRIGGAIYCSPLLDHVVPGSVRYDPAHMEPANNAARDFVALVEEQRASSSIIFHWTGNNAVLIDNWLCLHGREAVDASDCERSILRMYLGGRQ